ncbi:MAG: alpha/beta fold hydrolase [Acidobacteriota bacterium]
MTPSPSPDNVLVRQQLSEGFEHLLYQLAQGILQADEQGFHCDVLIIGSGYGGAVAATELSRPAQGEGASNTGRVWLLERGRAYRPGDFPDRLASLAGHVRVSTPQLDTPRGNRMGLFDVRLGPDMQAVLGNGLGGGSLINAGVMLWPSDEVMQAACWPEAIRQDPAALHRGREGLLKALGAQPAPIEPDGHGVLRKHAGLQSLAGERPFQRLEVTTAAHSGHTEQQVPVRACLHCGDCATGCNHGAKLSLDTTLLARAHQQGVQIYTGATALYLERGSATHGHASGWTVWCNHTDAKLRAEQDLPVALRARHVVIAAGTLGSTELLLRSRARGLSTSPLLGQRLSGNGDMLLSLYDAPAPMQAMADENTAPLHRQVGPTITGMVDWRQHTPHPFVLQDLAIPGPLQAIFEEYNAISQALCELSETDTTRHGLEQRDPSAIDPRAMAHTLPLAMIGHDGANGRIELIGTDPDGGDGAVRIVWPEVRRDPRFGQQLAQLQAAWTAQDPAHRETRLFATPGWQPFPPKLASTLEAAPGPLVTVHPLGGCAMGEDCWSGVVNHLGQVFDGQGDVYADLAVLDGSIIPTSLGVNPALTIAVIAQRAAAHLRTQWRLPPARLTDASGATHAEARFDPILLPDPHRTVQPQPTEIQITEQMRGWCGAYGIELTLRFEPLAARHLWAGMTHERVLQVDPAHSHVRIVKAHPTLPRACWDRHETVMQAPLAGTLAVFQREHSSPLQRQVRGAWAFLWNRGLRDAWQSLRPTRRRRTDPAWWRTVQDHVSQGWALASHAGQARRMDYALQIGPVPAGPLQHWAGQRLEGHKRIIYGRRSNPWQQLMDMTLTRCPPLSPLQATTGTVLSLDLDYLADQSVPLLRITQQTSMPDAMMDLARLGLQVARMMVPVHAWSMRKPETPKPRVICRLPSSLPGLPHPEVTELDVAPALADGTPVRLRLTRYRQKPGHRHAQGKPILMLHGYSASGTTFAHHALDPSLAQHLWDRGHDVWIADLRTSAGMPTGAQPWRFEDVGYVDIPLAVAHVSQATGGGQINVIAHCMGSAMLWMGLLGDPIPDYPAGSLLHQIRMDMPRRIHRLAMSQVAPIVVFSPANVLRAYVSQYIQTLLPMGAYRFRADVNRVNDGADMAMLDRLLMTIPYPIEDFDVENPPWQVWRDTAWVGTRRRMDALYGRDFKLSNLSPKLLPYLDDHFGPLSLSTMRQGLHLAMNRSIANAQGINTYLNEAKMRAVLTQLNAMMSFHGVDNGLSDIRGLYRFHEYIQRLGPPWSDKYTIHPIADHGHQDCLIGIHAQAKVFRLLDAFFEERA